MQVVLLESNIWMITSLSCLASKMLIVRLWNARYLAMSKYFTLCPVSAYDNLTNESSKRSFKEDNRQTYEHSPSIDTDKLATSLDSETSHSSPSTVRPKMKRKQRTMFSPLEVWELERVFAQRRYLMPEDEDELVQKLGVTARNVRVRFIYLSFWIPY